MENDQDQSGALPSEEQDQQPGQVADAGGDVGGGDVLGQPGADDGGGGGEPADAGAAAGAGAESGLAAAQVVGDVSAQSEGQGTLVGANSLLSSGSIGDGVASTDVMVQTEAASTSYENAKALHDQWVAQQVADGWGYGKVYDLVERRDPRIVHFDLLPKS